MGAVLSDSAAQVADEGTSAVTAASHLEEKAIVTLPIAAVAVKDDEDPASTATGSSPRSAEESPSSQVINADTREETTEDSPVAHLDDGSDEESSDDPVHGLAKRPCVDRIKASLAEYENFWTPLECDEIEQWIDATVRQADYGLFYGERTVDRTAKRGKYFFGHGYTYGRGMRGQEELLPTGAVDPIPDWMWQLLVKPLEARGVVPRGWIDSAVMNDYREGSSIVGHVDPPRLFSRPILTASFFCPARLVFGASFGPERLTAPVHMQPLRRGTILSLDGYAANRVTHGIRPEDLLGPRRVSIVLRHVIKEQEDVPRSLQRSSDESWILLWTVQGTWCDSPGPDCCGRLYIVRDWVVTIYFASAPMVPAVVLHLSMTADGLSLNGSTSFATLTSRGAVHAPALLRWRRRDDDDGLAPISYLWNRIGV